jgi:hypothetical protein
MMDSDELIACIGKAEDSPEVKKVLAGLGITTRLKMPKDDIDVRHVLRNRGLTLVFKPESAKSSRLLLTAVLFISSAEEGFASFAGALPAGLELTDQRPQVHAKLGAPLIEKPKLRRDIWALGELRLAIKYAKDDPHRIAVITVHSPLEE